jgi:hypothetical protein
MFLKLNLVSFFSFDVMTTNRATVIVRNGVHEQCRPFNQKNSRMSEEESYKRSK